MASAEIRVINPPEYGTGPVIFISYRTTLSANAAGRLAQVLTSEVGDERIVLDSRVLLPGDDWCAKLASLLSSCKVMLVLISPGWRDHTNESGEQRLAIDKDPVRDELVSARNLGIHIVPILVDSASVDELCALPDGIPKLDNLHCYEIRSKFFEADVITLLDLITISFPEIRPWITEDIRNKLKLILAAGSGGALLGYLLADINQKNQQIGYRFTKPTILEFASSQPTSWGDKGKVIRINRDKLQYFLADMGWAPVQFAMICNIPTRTLRRGIIHGIRPATRQKILNALRDYGCRESSYSAIFEYTEN